MGKKKLRGNTFHLDSGKLANTFTVEPSPSTSIVETLKLLHGLLWGREECIGGTVFSDFHHPSWNRNTNPHINSDDRGTAVKLSISDISRGTQRLPCGASELVVRKAYREVYDTSHLDISSNNVAMRQSSREIRERIGSRGRRAGGCSGRYGGVIMDVVVEVEVEVEMWLWELRWFLAVLEAGNVSSRCCSRSPSWHNARSTANL